MSPIYNRPALLVLVLTLLSALLISSTSANTSTVSGTSAGPTLMRADALAFTPGTVTVLGEAFTPDGEVYVALYDKWGVALHETRWVSASPAIYGPRGSTDPALGYRQGGDLNETFGGLCGATVMVRAYDRATAAWSNWLDIEPVTTGSAVRDPYSGIDPARRYRSGC
jgi:hypothetical protein